MNFPTFIKGFPQGVKKVFLILYSTIQFIDSGRNVENQQNTARLSPNNSNILSVSMRCFFFVKQQ